MHNHANSYVSGVYYIAADDKVDKIIFHKPDFEYEWEEAMRYSDLFPNKQTWVPRLGTPNSIITKSSIVPVPYVPKGHLYAICGPYALKKSI